jgi:hypothetical protein
MISSTLGFSRVSWVGFVSSRGLVAPCCEISRWRSCRLGRGEVSGDGFWRISPNCGGLGVDASGFRGEMSPWLAPALAVALAVVRGQADGGPPLVRALCRAGFQRLRPASARLLEFMFRVRGRWCARLGFLPWDAIFRGGQCLRAPDGEGAAREDWLDRPGSEFSVRTAACRIVGVSSRGGDVPPAEGHPQRAMRSSWELERAGSRGGPHYVGGSIPAAPVQCGPGGGAPGRD